MSAPRSPREMYLAERLHERPVIRYLIALAMVVVAVLLRLLATPLTGAGAPFVLFFGAMLVTSLIAGVGAGVTVLTVSLPIAAYMFVVRAGYSYSQAAFQALLYAIDGALVLYVTARIDKAHRAI